MMYLLYAAIFVGGCVVIRKMERNTTLMEQHTRELLEKAQKFDAIFEKLKTITM
jgi:hypothetical protein